MKNFLRLIAIFAFMFLCFLFGAHRIHALSVSEKGYVWLIIACVVLIAVGFATAFFPDRKITK